MGWGDPIEGTWEERLLRAVRKVDTAARQWEDRRSLLNQERVDEAHAELRSVLSQPR